MGDIVSPDKIKEYEIIKTALSTQDVIYIYGPSSSGKTYLARRALDRNESVSYAYVDCNIVTTSTKLYVQILSSLRDALKFSSKRTRGRCVELPKLLGFTDFLSAYQELVEFGQRKGLLKLYVVLDRLDCLLKTGMINTLQPILEKNVLNLVCISNADPRDIMIGLKSFVGRVSFNDRICLVQIPGPSKSELVDLICMDEPRVEPELYRKFVNNVVNLLYPDRTRDLHDLRTFCQQNYPEFYRYYEMKFKEIIKKKEKILDELEDSVDLDDFELDQASCSAIIMGFLGMLREKIAKKDMHTWNQAGEQIDRQVVLCTSVLIIAAYVAAYTKPSDDKKNFIKFQKRKVQNRVDRNEGNDIKAKPFTMERLLHIYRGILTSIQRGDDEDKTKENEYLDVQLTDSVLGDVSQLEQLGMIEVVTGDTCDAQLRYRISTRVGRKYVDRIAEQINFSLKYIYGLNY